MSGVLSADRPETVGGRSIDALLKEWRGFERRERLDVKKPGPSYNVNNYYFQRVRDCAGARLETCPALP